MSQTAQAQNPPIHSDGPRRDVPGPTGRREPCDGSHASECSAACDCSSGPPRPAGAEPGIGPLGGAAPLSSPWRMVITVAVMMGVAEAATMFILSLLPTMSVAVIAAVDSCVLLVLLSPALYVFLLRPLVRDKRAFRASGERTRSLIENLPVGLYRATLGEDGRFVMANPAMARLFGYDSAEDLCLLPVSDIFLDAGRTALSDRLVREGRVVRQELQLTRRDGERIWAAVTAEVVRGPSGEILHYDGEVEDITERKAAERALRETEERFRLLVETAFDGISITEFDQKERKRRLVFCNNRYVEMSGLSLEELDEADDLSAHVRVHPPHGGWDETAERAEGGEPVTYRASWRRPDGAENVFESLAVPVRVGSKTRLLAFDRDVTERERVERALEQAAVRWQETFDAIGDLVVVLDMDRKIVRANRAVTDAFPHQTTVGSPCYTLFHGVADAPSNCHVCKAFEEGEPAHAEHCEPHLGNRWFEVMAYPVRDPDGEVCEVVHILSDITERKRAEEELARVRAAVDDAGDAVLIADRNGQPLYVNIEFAYLFGRRLAEMQECGLESMFVDPAVAEEALADVSGIGTWSAETTMVSARGKQFPALVRATAVLDDRLETTGVLLVCSDITERKEAEERVQHYADRLEALNAELERSNRDLEDFTYTVSHDLQEPLRKVHTFGEFLMEDCADVLPREGVEYVRHMQGATRRMKRLIRHFLELARVGTRGGDMVPMELGEAVGAALDTLSARMEGCGASATADPDLPRVTGDAVQLEQVFQNLIGNALKFSSPDRQPVVHVGAEANGRDVTVTVSDNGIGIAPEHIEKVFGVFERLHTREEYEGAGVGLALCRKIVQRHDGKIWAESKLGRGTAFHFTLPLASAQEVLSHEG